MRSIPRWLLAGSALSLLSAAPVAALPITPDPLSFSFNPNDMGTIEATTDGATLTFTLDVTDGSLIKRLGIELFDSSGNFRTPEDFEIESASEGVEIQSITHDGMILFKFKGLRPPSSITLTIRYDGLIEIGDTVLWEFDKKENRTAEGLVIPEPSTLLLVALGLGGVGLAAARARRR